MIYLLLIGVAIYFIVKFVNKSAATSNSQRFTHQPPIFASYGGEDELRREVRIMANDLPKMIRSHKPYLTNQQVADSVIEMLPEFANDVFYSRISEFEVKFKMSNSAVKKVISEELSRMVIMQV